MHFIDTYITELSTTHPQVGLHSARYKQWRDEIAIIWAMNIIIISNVSEV